MDQAKTLYYGRITEPKLSEKTAIEKETDRFRNDVHEAAREVFKEDGLL
jgi:hypothetical protein